MEFSLIHQNNVSIERKNKKQIVLNYQYNIFVLFLIKFLSINMYQNSIVLNNIFLQGGNFIFNHSLFKKQHIPTFF